MKIRSIDIQMALDHCDGRGLNHGSFLGCLARKLNSILAGEVDRRISESRKAIKKTVVMVSSLDSESTTAACKT